MERKSTLLVSVLLVLGLCGLLVLVAAVAYLLLWPRGQCSTVLDADTLSRLVLSMEKSVAMQPGAERSFALGTIECCYFFEPVQACATWSADPSEGARIDPHTGVFAVDESTPSGSVFTVSADVEDGRRVVSVEVHVFTPQEDPLVGMWREEAQFVCSTGEEVVPERAVGELRFKADGGFSVTWEPFEVYKDYWGTYAYEMDQGTLSLSVTGGNYVPDDVDGGGSLVVDEEGRLILRDLWLGSPFDGTGPANCGHRFTRMR
jgi:hypothetical protein